MSGKAKDRAQVYLSSYPSPLHKTVRCVVPDLDNNEDDNIWHVEIFDVSLVLFIECLLCARYGDKLYNVGLTKISKKHTPCPQGPQHGINLSSDSRTTVSS